MSKITKYGEDAQDLLMKGVDFMVDAVALTEGPRGLNIIMGQRAMGQSPKVSRDGVSVANYVDPDDPTMQMGADLVREACQKTDNSVGDGTTCTAVLAREIMREGFQMIRANKANPMAIERGIQKAVKKVIETLQANAIPATDENLFQVATISAHGDTVIGRLVSDAIIKAGPDGIVTAEPSTTANTYVETVPGIELPKSNLLSQAFITHPEEMKAEMNDCRILLWEGVISTGKSLVPLLTQVSKSASPAPLLIVAGGYEPEALSIIISNRMKLGPALPVVAVRMEVYGDRRKEVLRDIAALTGGKAYTEELGMKIENVKLEELGRARKVVTNMSKTQIIDGRGNQEELVGRIGNIRTQMETAAPAEKVILKQRLAALTGGITILKVGGVTVTEMEERRDRVVDALSAAKAAADEGIIAGGGIGLGLASDSISEMVMDDQAESFGAMIIYAACEAVTDQIIRNAGEIPDTCWEASDNPNWGYNAATGKFEDLLVAGVVDPVKVIVEALRNAAAVACSILTMGAVVAEKPQQENRNA